MHTVDIIIIGHCKHDGLAAHAPANVACKEDSAAGGSDD